MSTPTKTRIFSDTTSVSRGACILLNHAGLVNNDGTVVSWSRLNPVMRDRMMTEKEAKQLILLEITRKDGIEPREDLINRLVNYLTNIDREDIRSKVTKHLKK